MQTQTQWPTDGVRAPALYEKRDAVALLIDNVSAAFALGYQGDASMDAAICGALGVPCAIPVTRTHMAAHYAIHHSSMGGSVARVVDHPIACNGRHFTMVLQDRNKRFFIDADGVALWDGSKTVTPAVLMLAALRRELNRLNCDAWAALGVDYYQGAAH